MVSAVAGKSETAANGKSETAAPKKKIFSFSFFG
jgi:hypothetical protein